MQIHETFILPGMVAATLPRHRPHRVVYVRGHVLVCFASEHAHWVTWNRCWSQLENDLLPDRRHLIHHKGEAPGPQEIQKWAVIVGPYDPQVRGVNQAGSGPDNRDGISLPYT
jgi:hypothetical protein